VSSFLMGKEESVLRGIGEQGAEENVWTENNKK
jgi:hypothetical protein